MRNETTILINVVLVLLLIGTLMAYSTPELPQDSAAIADAAAFDFPMRHMIFLSIGGFGLLVGMLFKYKNYADQRWLTYLVVTATFACLVWVLWQGINVRGGVRWIWLGFFSFQPSEIAKFAIILWLALKLSEHQEHIKEFWRGFLPSYLIMGLFCAMVLAQRDLGTTVVIGVTAMTMIFFAGARLSHVVLGVLPGIVGVIGLIIFTPWRLDRVKIFLDPWRDPYGDGYQLIQSLTAFARGGLRGRGLGAGEQKLGFLPDVQSDFIFPAWAEETGFMGSLAVVALFIVFMAVAFRIALNAQDRFGSLLGVGIATLISIQAVFNIAVTASLIPTKGLPLPFISEGGTALVINMTLIGILINIGLHASPVENNRPNFKRSAAAANLS
jgi:cell division protein FtsW